MKKEYMILKIQILINLVKGQNMTIKLMNKIWMAVMIYFKFAVVKIVRIQE
jgi:hypothetical protein